MRLHTALEHISAGHFRSMEPWKAGEAEELARYVQACAANAAEFTFSFLDADPKDDTLQTFIDFSNELWDAEIAPIPHDVFWISWIQKVLDEHVHMAALCERDISSIDGKVVALSVRVMFENHRRDGFAFLNQIGKKIIGDHKHVLISNADNDSTQLLIDTGFGVAAALIGALATPQAVRREEPVPERLNKQRAQKKKPPIGPMIVIDVRASQQASLSRKGEGGWTVKPHWRRGHIRHLADGRLIPIPPCCVNMETGVPIKPEYVVKV
jgi:hypothetical protein